MLDSTDDVGLDTTLDVPAISVQLSSTIGATRSLTLTTGLPLDCSKGQLDTLLDKLVAASDRQKQLFDAEQTRQLLKNEEQTLHLHRERLADQKTLYMSEWERSNKRGNWAPYGSQKSTLDGLDSNIKNSVERIKQLRKNIEEMDARCR